MVKGLKQIRLDSHTTPFNLDFTLACGQTFRWEKRGDWWHGVIYENSVKIRQVSNVLQYRTCPEDYDDSFIRNYFRLDDDLPHIYSQIEKDKHITEATRQFRGLRLIRQDSWECLISYICATNKNIPSIKNMINNMCTRFGRRVTTEELDGYTFPKPHYLAEASLKELGLCKLGFRAERVKQTSKLVNNGILNLETLKNAPYEEAKKELLSLPGVGPKVADCVLLFSLDKLEAFPIDVWMKRVFIEFYRDHFEKSFAKKMENRKGLSPNEYGIISSFGRRYFGEYVGYAQEYLFHFKRCID